MRMDRMTALQPIFIDVTWGAGGSTKKLTMSICEYAQTYFGVDVLLHLSCTGLTVAEIKRILQEARDVGIHNVLALRGDPAKGSTSWQPTAGGLHSAKELVQLIRSEHGDYFGIAVAGFPEGYPYCKRTGDAEIDGALRRSELQHLKEKVDAGADFIITQFFYDAAVFVNYVNDCASIGITCPIIPGMMPIQSYSSFQKMTSYCRTRVPMNLWTDLERIKNDDEKVKKYGEELCIAMCEELQRSAVDVKGFHFFTLNLEKSVTGVLDALGVSRSAASRR